MGAIEKNRKVMIMAGGTGGHVMPALAVAHYLQEQGVTIHWLGTLAGFEARLIPSTGIPISYIAVKGLRRTLWFSWVLAPWQISRAIWQSWRVILKERPDVVLSMGGYVAGPGAIAAWLLRCPLVLHEQNAVPGWTNKILANLAQRIMVAFPQVFSHLALKKKVLLTGNPVRKEILALTQHFKAPKTPNTPLNILILGGSQGAATLNEIIPQAIALLPAVKRPHIWHQTGKNHYDKTRENYLQQNLGAKISDFIEDMAQAYQWADVVICRSGALTVAEISISGVASILIPFPYATDDHQTSNAKYLSSQGAAILCPQTALTTTYLSNLLLKLIDNPQLCDDMALACQKLAKPLATHDVAQQCLEVSGGF